MGLGFGRAAPLAESPGRARPFSRASLLGLGSPSTNTAAPSCVSFAGQTGGQTAESSGPSQYPGPAGLGEMKILEGSGGGEGAEVPSTWEAEDKDLD